MPTTTPPKKKKITGKMLEEARAELQRISAAEAKLLEEKYKIRNFLADNLHDGVEGAKSFEIDGIKLSITRNLTRSISPEEAERMGKEQDEEIVRNVIRWKPEVKVGEYKKHIEILDEYIVTKEGPPTVAFK